MNYSLIAGITAFVFGVIFSILMAYDERLEIVAVGFYSIAVYGIFNAMLRKAESNG